jgi:hypothetical protein
MFGKDNGEHDSRIGKNQGAHRQGASRQSDSVAQDGCATLRQSVTQARSSEIQRIL